MRKKKKRFNFSRLFRRSSVSAVILILLTALFELFHSIHAEKAVVMPSAQEPLELYANQLNDDLMQTYLKAINGAQRSITLVIYSLVDRHIIGALHQKSVDGIPVYIVCDGKASVGISRKLPLATIVKRLGQGLTHQKILIVDDKQILLGSANLTHDSLKVHGNLVIGLENAALAKTMTDKIKSMNEEGHFTPLMHLVTQAGSETVELWELPDDPQAVSRMMQLFQGAKKTIRVAMFTWTRMDFTQAMIAAHKRGVKVEVVIDRYCAKGASAKIVKLLSDAGIQVRMSTGKGLLHHKFAYIDETILVNGSANWTKAAFTVNDDYFLVIYPLTGQHTNKMNELWKVIWQQSSK